MLRSDVVVTIPSVICLSSVICNVDAFYSES